MLSTIEYLCPSLSRNASSSSGRTRWSRTDGTCRRCSKNKTHHDSIGREELVFISSSKPTVTFGKKLRIINETTSSSSIVSRNSAMSRETKSKKNADVWVNRDCSSSSSLAFVVLVFVVIMHWFEKQPMMKFKMIFGSTWTRLCRRSSSICKFHLELQTRRADFHGRVKKRSVSL